MNVDETIVRHISQDNGNLEQQLVDALFFSEFVVELEIGAVVLTKHNPRENTVDRVALSNTAPAEGAVRASALPFDKIRIPMNAKENALVASIEQQEIQLVSDWAYLFLPVLSARQARDNQAGAGIMSSLVVPYVGTTSKGALILSLLCSPHEVNKNHYEFGKKYASIVAAYL